MLLHLGLLIHILLHLSLWELLIHLVPLLLHRLIHLTLHIVLHVLHHKLLIITLRLLKLRIHHLLRELILMKVWLLLAHIVHLRLVIIHSIVSAIWTFGARNYIFIKLFRLGELRPIVPVSWKIFLGLNWLGRLQVSTATTSARSILLWLLWHEIIKHLLFCCGHSYTSRCVHRQPVSFDMERTCMLSFVL